MNFRITTKVLYTSLLLLSFSLHAAKTFPPLVEGFRESFCNAIFNNSIRKLVDLHHQSLNKCVDSKSSFYYESYFKQTLKYRNLLKKSCKLISFTSIQPENYKKQQAFMGASGIKHSIIPTHTVQIDIGEDFEYPWVVTGSASIRRYLVLTKNKWKITGYCYNQKALADFKQSEDKLKKEEQEVLRLYKNIRVKAKEKYFSHLREAKIKQALELLTSFIPLFDKSKTALRHRLGNKLSNELTLNYKR